MRSRTAVIFAIAAFTTATFGCSLLVSFDGFVGGGTGGDGAAPSGDGAVDGATTTDASSNGDATIYTYNDFSDPSRWSQFDLSAVDAGSIAFTGSTSDGRYLYAAPYQNVGGAYVGEIVRLDTSGAFSDSSSWSTYDTSVLSNEAEGYAGAQFDGRYVYLIPSRYGTGSYSGLVVRFDTQQTFTNNSSWSTFDTQSLSTPANGLAGGGFDGRYMFFGPQYGNFVRYDTQASFNSAASWVSLSAEKVAVAASTSLSTMVYDGARYFYFLPNGTTGPNDVIRYDQQAPIASQSSWAQLDVSSITNNRYSGASFDGRYVYLSPITDPNFKYSGIVLRYDTQLAFADTSSWTTFDTTTIDPNALGFYATVFDGRYVYMVPGNTAILIRYDTQAAFGAPGSWSKIDTENVVAPGASSFAGSWFDGTFMYLFPGSEYHSIALRFDAREPQ